MWMFYPETGLSADVVRMDPQPILRKYGSFFLTSSIAWMFAQALEEGATEIALAGVDMEYDTEYRRQRAGVRHFVDIARMLGVNVRRVADSGIALDPVPYPMCMEDPILSKVALRKKSLDMRKQDATGVEKSMREQMFKRQGALEDMMRMASEGAKQGKTFDPIAYVKSRIDQLQKDIPELLRSSLIARDDVKWVEGCLAELDWLEDYLQS